MSKIVIFGGSGFIGTALCTLLDQSSGGYYAPDELQLDLEYEDAPEQISKIVNDGDSIVMIAALTSEYGLAHQLIERNIRMATYLIDGLADKDISHCTYISSDSVYAETDAAIDECTALGPRTLYGMMHMAREKMLAERFPDDRLTILRPCAVYGRDDTHNAYGINQFIRGAKKNGMIEIFGDGEEMRSNIHVDDLAVIIAKAAQERIAGIFNANCGEAYTFKELAQMVGNVFGAEIISKPRTQPVTHRRVDNSKLVATFHPPLRANFGIARTW